MLRTHTGGSSTVTVTVDTNTKDCLTEHGCAQLNHALEEDLSVALTDDEPIEALLKAIDLYDKVEKGRSKRKTTFKERLFDLWNRCGAHIANMDMRTLRLSEESAESLRQMMNWDIQHLRALDKFVCASVLPRVKDLLTKAANGELSAEESTTFFGAELCDARALRGWSRSDAAAAVGISEGVYVQLEAGTRLPGMKLKARLDEAFGVQFGVTSWRTSLNCHMVVPSTSTGGGAPSAAGAAGAATATVGNLRRSRLGNRPAPVLGASERRKVARGLLVAHLVNLTKADTRPVGFLSRTNKLGSKTLDDHAGLSPVFRSFVRNVASALALADGDGGDGEEEGEGEDGGAAADAVERAVERAATRDFVGGQKVGTFALADRRQLQQFGLSISLADDPRLPDKEQQDYYEKQFRARSCNYGRCNDARRPRLARQDGAQHGLRQQAAAATAATAAPQLQQTAQTAQVSSQTSQLQEHREQIQQQWGAHKAKEEEDGQRGQEGSDEQLSGDGRVHVVLMGRELFAGLTCAP